MIDKYMNVICAVVATAIAMVLWLVCVILLIAIHEEITKQNTTNPAAIEKVDSQNAK